MTIFLEHGSEAQKAKYLTAAVEGKIGAFALTDARSRALMPPASQTKAVVDGDDLYHHGNKCFISNMGPTEGDYVVVIALTEPEKGTKGMSAIVVDRGTPASPLASGKRSLASAVLTFPSSSLKTARVPPR